MLGSAWGPWGVGDCGEDCGVMDRRAPCRGVAGVTGGSGMGEPADSGISAVEGSVGAGGISESGRDGVATGADVGTRVARSS